MRWVTASSQGNCVEVAAGGDTVRVRDSKNPGVTLVFTVEEWRVFLEGVRAGMFDVDQSGDQEGAG